MEIQPPSPRTLFENFINARLEDLLVAARRAELMIEIRQEFEKTPPQDRAAFIQWLPRDIKGYIARDATFMHVLRVGEQLKANDPRDYEEYCQILDKRSDTVTRDATVSPGGRLARMRDQFHHPENYPMPEPPARLIRYLFKELRTILTDAFPSHDFREMQHKPTIHLPSETEEQQIIWSPGRMITEEVEFNPYEEIKKGRLDSIAFATSRARVYHPNDINLTNFEEVLELALDFRQCRIGALARSINYSEDQLRALNIPVKPALSSKFADTAMEIRRLFAHHYDTLQDRPENMVEVAMKKGKPINAMLIESMRQRQFNFNRDRFSRIPKAPPLLDALQWKIEAEKNGPGKSPDYDLSDVIYDEPVFGKSKGQGL